MLEHIKLSNGLVARVDKTDFEAVRCFPWFAVKQGNIWYAHANVTDCQGHRILKMHRMVAGALRGQAVDHRNGDGLDNTKGNLRLATKSQNAANGAKHKDGKSKFKGVSFDKQTGKWRAQLFAQGKRVNIGRFVLEEDAARAYDGAAKQAFGDFSRTNFDPTSFI